MSVLELIDEIENILEESSSVPFSEKVIVSKEELLEILNEVKIKLPDEIKQANWVREEQKRILAEAQKEADTIVSEAKTHLKELVEEDEITKQAKERAEEIMTKVQTNAKEIRLGSMEYADNILGKVQGNLKELQDNLNQLVETLDRDRQELR